MVPVWRVVSAASSLAISLCDELKMWFPIKCLCFKPLPCFASLLVSWVCCSLCLITLYTPQLFRRVMLERPGSFLWLSRHFLCFCYLLGTLSLSISRLLLEEQISKCSEKSLVGWIAPLADHYIQHSCDHWSFLCYHWSSDIKRGGLSRSLKRGETRTCGYAFSRAAQSAQWKIQLAGWGWRIMSWEKHFWDMKIILNTGKQNAVLFQRLGFLVRILYELQNWA